MFAKSFRCHRLTWSLKGHQVEPVHDGHELGALREVRREVGRRDPAVRHRQRELHVHLGFSLFHHFSILHLSLPQTQKSAQLTLNYNNGTRVQEGSAQRRTVGERNLSTPVYRRFGEMTSLLANPALPLLLSTCHAVTTNP